MKLKQFNVYEIKDPSDERQMISELQRIGCAQIRIIARDDGAVRIECLVPEQIRNSYDLEQATTLSL